MKMGVKKMETFEKALERRQFVEGLRADSNVLYIKLEPDFDYVMGSFYIYDNQYEQGLCCLQTQVVPRRKPGGRAGSAGNKRIV